MIVYPCGQLLWYLLDNLAKKERNVTLICYLTAIQVDPDNIVGNLSVYGQLWLGLYVNVLL